uniref:Protoheme IX farnesyltransferase, mitochondrial n=1 Tax=Amorphochlora amoebiformis TaxID=1561963 RepID=A0A7S0CSP4_9EUKA|mmetsp:Transcript_11909/g.18922  ORF Transcript_11909/g.18922 Transcript_11909/m.18922 type:complete len:394 (+) Transcript_11909:44-1225(+)
MLATRILGQVERRSFITGSSRGLVRHFATKRSYVTPPSNAVQEKPVVRTLKRWGNPRDYVELAKPELSALVITTGTWGFLLTGCVDPVAGVSTVAGLVLSAASAASWNQTSEVEYDKLMLRTRTRPLPAGRLTKQQGAAFSAITGIGGVSLLFAGANPLTGALGLANIALYGMAYTPMKRVSVYNTHVGAIVGALPVVIGWTGGGGALIAIEPAMLFSILFAWQFPHFMGIAWKYRKDYKIAGYRMVTRDDTTGSRTAMWARNGALVLMAIPFASTGLGMTSSMFIVSSLLPNSALMYSCYKFEKKPSSRNANFVILVGFVYLMAFLGLMFFHSTSEALAKHIDSARNVMRRVGRSMCVHETQMTNAKILCPAPSSDVQISKTCPIPGTKSEK